MMKKNGFGSLLVSFITVGIMYSAMGALVGTLWAWGAVPLDLPYLSLAQFLALWWAWMLTLVPVIMFAVSYFRATDPLTALAQGGLGAFKKK